MSSSTSRADQLSTNFAPQYSTAILSQAWTLQGPDRGQNTKDANLRAASRVSLRISANNLCLWIPLDIQSPRSARQPKSKIRRLANAIAHQ